MHLTRKRDASKEQSAGSTTLAVSNSTRRLPGIHVLLQIMDSHNMSHG